MCNEQKVWEELLLTWQPVAAIAHRVGIPVKTCLAICEQFYHEGKVKCSRVRIDGHNRVHLYKKIEFVQVFSQRFSVNNADAEA